MTSWLYTVDWQAIFTLLMAIVLGLFAWKTWRVSRQQSDLDRRLFEIQHEPDLLCDPRTLMPESGSLVKNYITGSKEFNGVAWDLRLFNPGQTIMAIRRINAYLINVKNQKRIPLGKVPTFYEVIKGTPNDTIEYPPDLHVKQYDEHLGSAADTTFPIYLYPSSQSSPLNIGLWVYEEVTSLRQSVGLSPGQALLRDIQLHSVNTEREFKLEVDITYDCLSTKKRKNIKLNSLPITLGGDITFKENSTTGKSIRKSAKKVQL